MKRMEIGLSQMKKALGICYRQNENSRMRNIGLCGKAFAVRYQSKADVILSCNSKIFLYGFVKTWYNSAYVLETGGW